MKNPLPHSRKRRRRKRRRKVKEGTMLIKKE
jgi:hypothetical protein